MFLSETFRVTNRGTLLFGQRLWGYLCLRQKVADYKMREQVGLWDKKTDMTELVPRSMTVAGCLIRYVSKRRIGLSHFLLHLDGSETSSNILFLWPPLLIFLCHIIIEGFLSTRVWIKKHPKVSPKRADVSSWSRVKGSHGIKPACISHETESKFLLLCDQVLPAKSRWARKSFHSLLDAFVQYRHAIPLLIAK